MVEKGNVLKLAERAETSVRLEMKDISEISEHIVKANTDTVRFFGRTVSDIQEDRVYFNWTCSGFEFTFTGISAEALLLTDIRQDRKIAEFGARAHIGVYVDGQTEAVTDFLLDEERKWYTLAQNLPYGNHTIRVVKLSEVGYGRSAVMKIKVMGLEDIRPTLPKNRRLEFIGDSITCGYGNICTTKSPDFITWEENGYRTFAAFIAQEFEAEANFISVSGTGVFHDYGMNTHNLIPELYGYTDKMLYEHYGKPAKAWNFENYIPDLIVMRLGQNDSRYCEGWDRAEEERTEDIFHSRRKEFKEKYQEFLLKIITFNPNILILCHFDNSMSLKYEIKEAIEEIQKKNSQVHYIELPEKSMEEGVGANGHWSVCTHRRAANTLSAKIREITGW